ncbi:MAG TPA: protein translocase subunit SecF, partial [Idiomarina loihiensis]|nr:protein translocase subunit SecF [Idiomarina loihiensis]
MQEIIKTDERLPFMRFRGIMGIISAVLVVASIVSLSVNKLNFGLDFTGGTLLEVGFDSA